MPNLEARDVAETSAGAVAVAAAIALLWLLGSVAEPYMQWLPAVRDLQHHAWYSTAAPAAAGIGRALYVGATLIVLGFVALSAGILGAYAVIVLRDLGRVILRRPAATSERHR